MADGAEFTIPTRQKADVLFESSTPLGVGDSFTSDVKRVSGYAQISILAISDQPFGINVEEACVVDINGVGNFVQTGTTLMSSAVGGQQVICTRIQPFGNFMKMVLGNLGPGDMTSLSFSAQGIPLP